MFYSFKNCIVFFKTTTTTTFLIADSLAVYYFGVMYSFNSEHTMLMYVNDIPSDCKPLEDSNCFLNLSNTVYSLVLNM